MKKTYQNPALEVVKLQMRQQMLAGSDPKIGEDYNGEKTLGRSLDFDDEEE